MARATDRHQPRGPEEPQIAETLEPVTLPEDGLPHDARYVDALLDGRVAGDGVARGVSIETSRGEQLDLTGVRLPGLSLQDVELRGGSFANADFQSASWRRVRVVRARLTGTRWTDAALDDVSFRDCRIDLAAFSAAELRRVRFVDCRITGSDFQELRAQDVVFEACDLSEVDLTGARFVRTEMRGCTIDGLRAMEQLRGVAMPWPDIVASAGAFASAFGVRLTEDE